MATKKNKTIILTGARLSGMVCEVLQSHLSQKGNDEQTTMEIRIPEGPVAWVTALNNKKAINTQITQVISGVIGTSILWNKEKSVLENKDGVELMWSIKDRRYIVKPVEVDPEKPIVLKPTEG